MSIRVLLSELISRLDTDAQFHLVGAVCAMQHDGRVSKELADFCLAEIEAYSPQFGTPNVLLQQIEVMCEAGYFNVRVQVLEVET